jgi:hypothetical protein
MSHQPALHQAAPQRRQKELDHECRRNTLVQHLSDGLVAKSVSDRSEKIAARHANILGIGCSSKKMSRSFFVTFENIDS